MKSIKYSSNYMSYTRFLKLYTNRQHCCQRIEMVLLDNSSFILRLQKLANSSKKDSSFTVTLKRYNGHDKPKPREGRPALPEPEEYMCLMRAQSKSKKISTVVKHDDVPKMMTMYAQFMKSSMDGLKRIKKVKSKAKAAKG